jgi:Uma2 family endonuclease
MAVQSEQQSATTRLFTVSEYYRMYTTGILSEDERVELLKGEIIQMTPIGSQHAACVNRLNSLFASLATAQKAVVAVQNPLHLDDYSEPQTDLVLARFQPDYYATQHPTPQDVLLLVEVCDTSEDYDRTVKLPLYALASIPEVWLVDLTRQHLEAYRQPSPQGYREMRWFGAQDRLAPGAFPEVEISLSQFLA